MDKDKLFVQVFNNNGWISTDDALPADDGHYLVWVEHSYPKNCNCLVAEFCGDDKDGSFYREANEEHIEDVLFWRPIPEAPK